MIFRTELRFYAKNRRLISVETAILKTGDLLLSDLRLVRENVKVVAAGWPEVDVILPPAVIDNADLYGGIGQSCI